MPRGLFPRSLRFLILPLLLIMLAVCGCVPSLAGKAASDIPPERLPMRFAVNRIVGLSPSLTCAIADLDNDGVSEALNIQSSADPDTKSPAHVTPADLLLESTGEQINFDGLISADCLDWDNDGDLEILVYEQRRDDVTLRAFDHRGVSLDSIPVVTDSPFAADPVWRCTVNAETMIDGNGDGRPDLLLRLHTNEAYQPRGLKLLDLQTKEWIWDFPAGACVEAAATADADLDGTPEIYLKTGAPANGVDHFINGTDDGRSWFIILSPAGKLLHREVAGGRYTAFLPLPYDMDHDGRPELALIKQSRNSLTAEKSSVAFWDPVQKRTLYLKEYEYNILDWGGFLDVNNDGIDELLTLSADGTVEARNMKNEIIMKATIGEKIGGRIITDIDSDGDKELLLCGQTSIYAFSQTLELLARREIERPEISLAAMGRGKPKNIVVRSRDMRLLLRLESNYIGSFSSARFIISGFLLGSAVTLLLVWFWHRKNENQPARWVPPLAWDHSSSGLMALDAAGRVVQVNPGLKLFTGRDSMPAVPCPLQDLLPPARSAEVEALIQEQLRHPERTSPRPLLLPDLLPGREIRLLMQPLHGRNGRLRGLLLTFEDTTEQSTSGRAIAWASLAQRLAHQIKTPLSSVLLATQRLQMEYRQDGIAKSGVYDRYIDYTAAEVARIRQITEGFLKFARVGAPALKTVNLNQLIIATTEKYRPLLTDGKELRTDLAADLPDLALDEQQIIMALSALIENGLDAMEGEGHLTITTRLQQNIVQGQKYATETVQIECADTGRGIPAEAMQKLFDPFYTSKSHGTGLGLPIAKRVIEEHHGTIEIRSEPGIGTVVIIQLPLN